MYVDVATTHLNTGKVYRHQGKYSEALAKYKEAERIYVKALGHDHESVAKTKRQTSIVRFEQQRKILVGVILVFFFFNVFGAILKSFSAMRFSTSSEL
mmetsp:Transcript_37300/g.93626  ORF Transcript_37300/g.93626 Transcript_37300/m.93626 type:complete len:98 (+) Transcript_37300:137-430(+)